MASVQDRIFDIIAKECDVERAIITPGSTLDSLGISSVDLVQVMFQIEEEFDVYLADEEVGFDVQNVGQVVDAVEKLVAAKAADA